MAKEIARSKEDEINEFFRLGYAYQNGIGVEKNIKEAVKWYRKAAIRGHADAQNKIGVRYLTGDGVFQDVQVAIKWFGRAAMQGHRKAMDNLHACFCNEESGCFESADIAKWFLRLAQSGLSEFQSKIGHCYFAGIGVEQNIREAISWVLRSKGGCENFREKWNNELVLGFCKGEENLNIVEINLFKDACKNDADKGNADGLYLLGACYEFGIGSKIDKVLAANFYLKAALQGSCGAQFRLAELLRGGLPSFEDTRTAEFWYREAAGRGHAAAEYAIGLYYSESKKLAVDWYRKSAEHGCLAAWNALGHCYKDGIGVRKNGKKASECYRAAGDFENPIAEKKFLKLTQCVF